MSSHRLDDDRVPADDAAATAAKSAAMPDPPASVTAARHPTLLGLARAAADKERRMTLRQAVRLYRPAIAWSVLFSTCIIMEAYSDVLVINLYSLPQFNRKYGQPVAGTDPRRPENWAVPPRWQSGLANGANCGELLGLLLCGWMTERIGYRASAIGSLLLVTLGIAVFFTARSVGILVVAEVLCGIPWGLFQALTITYAVEVSPLALRAYLTTYINACWGLGHLIGVGVLRGFLHRPGAWAYRVPFALQWIWPIPLAIGICYAPESPWWLVRRGAIDEAKAALRRLTGRRRPDHDSDHDVDVDETIAMMVHTMALEHDRTPRGGGSSSRSSHSNHSNHGSHSSGGGSGGGSGGDGGGGYLACFRGRQRRRTEIVAMVWAIQNLSGNSFSSYSTYFLTQAGLSSEHAFGFTLGQNAFNVAGVAGAWLLMGAGRVGRRALYVWGLVGLCAVLFVIGFLGLVPAARRSQASLATGSLLVCWALCYQLTVGTVCYALVAEIPSRRLLAKTVALGRALYLAVGILCSVVTPYMVGATAWDWGNFSSFFWAGTCLLCILYTYARVPEPTGLSFAEIDVLFDLGVSSRKFSSTQVDVFAQPIDADRARAYDANEAQTRVQPAVEP